MLAPLQMQIDTAENGKQALEMLEAHTYDLVFMDRMMPVMDGVEATVGSVSGKRAVRSMRS